MKRILPLLLLLVLAGCQDENPAQGRWSGVLIHDGTRVDLGKVHIGSDRIDIPQVDESYRHLTFYADGDEVRFGRQTGNFQGDSGSGFGPGVTQGVIRFDGSDSAQMTISRIQGIVKLSR